MHARVHETMTRCHAFIQVWPSTMALQCTVARHEWRSSASVCGYKLDEMQALCGEPERTQFICGFNYRRSGLSHVNKLLWPNTLVRWLLDLLDWFRSPCIQVHVVVVNM